MFYVLDNFFLGNIKDKALVMSLSALQLGAAVKSPCESTSCVEYQGVQMRQIMVEKKAFLHNIKG